MPFSVSHTKTLQSYNVPDNVYFFDNYIDAAIHAATKGLMSKEAMWRVASSAVDDFE